MRSTPGTIGADASTVDMDELEELAAAIGAVPSYDQATGEAILVAYGETYTAHVGAAAIPGCPRIALARVQAWADTQPAFTPLPHKADPPEWQIVAWLDRHGRTI